MGYSVAIDLSGSEAAFALGLTEKKEVLLEDFKAMTGRDSSSLLPWIISLLESKGIKTGDVSEWTAGTGPGSFTGLRLVSALIDGLTFGKDSVRTRGVPTALAMASGVEPAEGQKIAVLFDGRRRELLLFGAVNSSGKIEPCGKAEVISEENMAEKLADFDILISLGKDKKAMEDLLPGDLIKKITYLEHVPVSKLLFIDYENWEGDITELVYIRPAVFTKPRQQRVRPV